MNPIPYGRQSITQDDINAVVDVLQADFLTQGPVVQDFENEICKITDCQNAIAVANGTAALHLAAKALGVKPGQKVLCTTNSFAATSNCIEYCGGEVEFVDIDPKTLCIDYKQLKEKLSSQGPGTYSGVIVVDFAGYVADLETLRKIADEHKIWILEDACHAFGGSFTDSHKNQIKAGSSVYTDASVFSFHPVKHIAMGEGGAVTTNSKTLANKVRELRTHGITKETEKLSKNDGPWYYEMQELGFNYRIPDILCALGLSQLKRIDSNLSRRREIVERYNSELKDLPIELPPQSPSVQHAFHLYVIQTEDRKELYTFLRERGVYTQVHYIPIHTQPYYIEKYGKASFPNAEAYYEKALSLPMYHSLSDEQQGYVIEQVRAFYAS